MQSRTELYIQTSHYLIFSIHAAISSTFGLLYTKLYFLLMPQISICTFCGLTTLISETRLYPHLLNTGTHSSLTPISIHSETGLFGVFFSGRICGKNSTSWMVV